ncbi:MAG TPA: methyltransferase domain-containing protein [Gemmatimonadaceae bacterium]|nr:methyltransferase domain-containing protein [Gemmatimonadaceae bacterium]
MVEPASSLDGLDVPPGRNLSPAVPATEVDRIVAGVEPAVFRPILARCLAGTVSPQVALMQMICESESSAAVRAAIDVVTARTDADSRADDSIVRDRVDDLTRILVDHEDGVDRIVDMLKSGVDSSAPAATVEEGLAFCERLFDWSVLQSEEASVALYSLGSADTLERATDEVVALLDAWGVLGPTRRVLQIGCGIGRFERALAGRVAEAHGVDISAEMVRAARRRCAGLANVHLEKSSGRDLALYEAARFDLVYAVDTFPYLLQSGPELVDRHFAEARRVLVPGGEFAIFNFSYRGDLAADRADVERLAAEHGFTLLTDGVRPFTLWDGAVWRMEKTGKR